MPPYLPSLTFTTTIDVQSESCAGSDSIIEINYYIRGIKLTLISVPNCLFTIVMHKHI